MNISIELSSEDRIKELAIIRDGRIARGQFPAIKTYGKSFRPVSNSTGQVGSWFGPLPTTTRHSDLGPPVRST